MKIQVNKEKNGYSANIAEYSVYTEGGTFEELIANLEEAVSLRFEGEKRGSGNIRAKLLDSFEISA